MKLYDTGVYLQNGQEIIPENQADLPVAKEEAAKIAIQSARDFLEDEPGTTLEEIVFCTFTPQDKKLMDELLL